MQESTSMVVLVQDAVRGDEVAWRDIVRAYTPLLTRVCRRYGLSRMDAEDVRGRVWMHLLTNIARLREPAALPGWLRTTTRRECQTALRHKRQDIPLDDGQLIDHAASSDARLLAEEQRIVLWEAVDGLVDSDRRLLALLFSDPPMSYAQISRTLDMPVGAIGPTRQRILRRLRHAHVWRSYRPTL